MYIIITIYLSLTICYSMFTKFKSNIPNPAYKNESDQAAAPAKPNTKQIHYYSPINIIEGLTTERSLSKISFDYKYPNIDPESLPQFTCNDKSYTLEINLGRIKFNNQKDFMYDLIFQATKIVIKTPADHLFTIDSYSTRPKVELQIWHKLLNNEGSKEISYKQAIASINFEDSSEIEDILFKDIGISSKIIYYN